MWFMSLEIAKRLLSDGTSEEQEAAAKNIISKWFKSRRSTATRYGKKTEENEAEEEDINDAEPADV